MQIPRLQILLPTLLASWLLGCIAVHGPSIFAYLAMHALTTGVFAALMWRAESASATAAGSTPAELPKARPVDTEKVPARAADQQAAVA